MNAKSTNKVGYHFMASMAIVSGAAGVLLQFIPGWEILALMFTASALGGLVGGSPNYTQDERQHLTQSYKTSFEALLLIILAAYALIEISKALSLNVVPEFFGGHWPGLMIACMCALMGIAGLRKTKGDH